MMSRAHLQEKSVISMLVLSIVSMTITNAVTCERVKKITYSFENWVAFVILVTSGIGSFGPIV